MRDRGNPGRDGLDVARSGSHVHVGVPPQSEHEESRSLGEVPELDDGKFLALQSYIVTGQLPLVTGLCI